MKSRFYFGRKKSVKNTNDEIPNKYLVNFEITNDTSEISFFEFNVSVYHKIKR